jgi:nicotinamide N-methyltransferase
LELRLAAVHPLWGHHLWNAAKRFAQFLDTHAELYRGKRVLELGAGAALPSIIAALNGAHVVITDYPDQELLDNITWNVERNVIHREHVTIQGFLWGSKPTTLLTQGSFDLIILADLIFNHSQHDALLTTCEQVLAPGGGVYVYFSHHLPHTAERDMEFFTKARDRGFTTTRIEETLMEPMFAEDPGDVTVRATVHGFLLIR